MAAGRESTERCIVSRFSLAAATSDLTTLRLDEIVCEWVSIETRVRLLEEETFLHDGYYKTPLHGIMNEIAHRLRLCSAVWNVPLTRLTLVSRAWSLVRLKA